MLTSNQYAHVFLFLSIKYYYYYYYYYYKSESEKLSPAFRGILLLGEEEALRI